MADQQIYEDSTYRFTDPIRFFKANDPYYFEVDNIPLKQLQENCLWLKDQVRKSVAPKISGVKRVDIDELRPFATGSDRVLRVKPGRYTARINDASIKNPLAYLEKVMGEALGDVDAWIAALPNPGSFSNNKNAILQAALDTFKQSVASEAMGMTGLEERVFTRPIVNADTPVNTSGVELDPNVTLGHGDLGVNILGGGAANAPFIISQALLWAKSKDSYKDSVLLPSFETTNPNSGWAKYPRTENFFIKRWRGVSRLSIVDVGDELTIEVPRFDPDDFSYTNSAGTTTKVTGVESRVDLVFIYSKPIDTSAVNILKPTGKETITRPTLGIVRGAGIKTNFKESTNTDKDYISNLAGDHGIVAHPGDQKNTSMGFLSTSANDIAEDIKGSFPSPDDLLNLAPVISEKLEDSAYELVGQSILPVAYVWVQNGSQVVASTDVIDIRPMFRTAELAYNERAGIGAAFPQLSLANPAVGKGQLDNEIRNVYTELQSQMTSLSNTILSMKNMEVVAAGYVFGGWNFGPEGALFNHYETAFAGSNSLSEEEAEQYYKDYIIGKYGFGKSGAKVNIPSYPDWDLAQWCIEQNVGSKGLYPNDYINTFLSDAVESGDPTVVAGSSKEIVNADGTNSEGNTPAKLSSFSNTIWEKQIPFFVHFHYIQKKIKFNRPSWLADYKVDIDFINCLPPNSFGSYKDLKSPGHYGGYWVEKGHDEFTIYIAFPAYKGLKSGSNFPAPYTTKTFGGNSVTISERGGERFSSFIVPVGDILYSNTAKINTGYVGNPRMGKCTYPTIMWSLTGIPVEDANYFYGNLNSTNPVITLKGEQ